MQCVVDVTVKEALRMRPHTLSKRDHTIAKQQC
jgi:hypothetical protein